MFSRLCRYGYSQNAALLTTGLTFGYLGAHSVQWYRDKNHLLPHDNTIEILTFTKGNLTVKKIPSSAFTTYLSYEELNELRKSVGWLERTEKTWKNVIQKSAHLVFVKEENTLIGSACVIGNDRMGMICDVHVHPSHQNKRIGTLMMNHLVQELKEKEYAHIGLFGWEENATVLEFYEKFGFTKSAHAMQNSSKNLKLYVSQPSN